MPQATDRVARDAGGKLMLIEFIALLSDPDAFIAALRDGELCIEPRRELAI